MRIQRIECHAVSNSIESSGCKLMSLSKHKTPPGGVKRPCSQSRSVATGVVIRVANSACYKPVLARACRSKICSGVVTRPMPAFASLRAARSSAKGKPASASMALATFSIFILNTSVNVCWQNRSAARLGVHHHQHDHALLGQIKVNHTYATVLAATGDRPAHFASALDDIPAIGCSAIQSINVCRSASDHSFSACF